jgi:hypothetical protein
VKLPRQQRIIAIEIDRTRVAHLAMMPHCREGAMLVSQANFLDHVGKGPQLFRNILQCDPEDSAPPAERRSQACLGGVGLCCALRHTGSCGKPGLGATCKRDGVAAI